MTRPQHAIRTLLVFLLTLTLVVSNGVARKKEYLTDKEIEKIRNNYAIDARLKIYMEAAALRLKTAEERLTGKESEPGDPLEFFTPEDMLESYSEIMRSSMMNLDDAVQRPRSGGTISVPSQKSNSERLGSALKQLRSGTEQAASRLEIIKKLAEEKKKEELWNLVNEAMEVTDTAHEGAKLGLKSNPAPPEKEKKNRQ